MDERPADVDPAAAAVAAAGPGFSVGVDVEDLDRWRRPGRDLTVLFTPEERAYCEGQASPAAHFAGLWCAREAAFKALSPYVHLDLRQLHVGHDPAGRPVISIDDPAQRALAERLRVSISHSATTAMAFAVLDLRPPG
jgi:phosphopantetheine--protein transferase-like protein